MEQTEHQLKLRLPVTPDSVRELLLAGKSQSEVARELGVSRQRISQIIRSGRCGSVPTADERRRENLARLHEAVSADPHSPLRVIADRLGLPLSRCQGLYAKLRADGVARTRRHPNLVKRSQLTLDLPIPD